MAPIRTLAHRIAARLATLPHQGRDRGDVPGWVLVAVVTVPAYTHRERPLV